MAVVTFKVSGKDNCVTVGGTPYMYARTDIGSFVLPVQCPHRGGPLNLGTLDTSRADHPRLVCPWHEGAVSLRKATRRGIPAVRRGDYVTTVLSGVEADEYQRGHRPVSTDLAVTG